MKINEKSPASGSVPPRAREPADCPPAFTLESIQAVRDFTARRTLELAHALVTGLARLTADAESDDADRALLHDLESVGVTAHDAEQIAAQAVALIELMADRDRKADAFHEAVKEASDSERAMYERLTAVMRVLRARLGGRSPALAQFGVRPDGGDADKARPKHAPKAIFSALMNKSA